MNSLRLLSRQGSLSALSRSASPMVTMSSRTLSSYANNLDRLRTTMMNMEAGGNPDFVNLAQKTGKLKQRRPWIKDAFAGPDLPFAIALQEELSENDSAHNLDRLRGVVHAVAEGKKPEFFCKGHQARQRALPQELRPSICYGVIEE